MRSVPPVSNGSASLPFDPAAERLRLLRLCRRWSGNAQAAEDLAQEAVLIGLRRAGADGSPPREWSSYLAGIARHLCQNWQRQHIREDSQLSSLTDVQESRFAIESADVLDPLNSLLQAEREELVERALNTLKDPVRQVLIARYVTETPLSELAAQWGLSENAAAVRIHRSREALKKVLETTLRTEAASHGLLDPEAAEGWRETPIFCCRCGRERLWGRFEAADFALICPVCTGQLVGMTSQVVPLDASQVLKGVRGFRAGLNRVNHWWQGYIEDALRESTAACVRCGRPASVGLSTDEPGLKVYCDFCRATTFYIHPTGLLYHSEEAQLFWRRYPRMRNQDHRDIICEGRAAIVTSFADPASAARIEMVFDTATLRPLRVETIGV